MFRHHPSLSQRKQVQSLPDKNNYSRGLLILYEMLTCLLAFIWQKSEYLHNHLYFIPNSYLYTNMKHVDEIIY